MDLFDAEIQEYKLYDEMRRQLIRVSPHRLTEFEARAANDRFVKAKCPHLQWRKPAEISQTINN